MKCICLQVSILLVVISCGGPKHSQTVPANNQYGSFSIRRGTNIAHWLSQSNRRGNERASFFTEKDIDFIKSAGFDHIRLPVDEEQLWDSSEKREEEAFRLLNDCMAWVH